MNVAPSSCTLKTTEISYKKNEQPGYGQMSEFTDIINKIAMITYLSKKY